MVRACVCMFVHPCTYVSAGSNGACLRVYVCAYASLRTREYSI